LLLLLFSPLLSGAELSTYRGFQFGMSLNAAAKHSGMDMSEVRTIGQRPALIQELTCNPEWLSSRATDPVQQVVFGFYNGQLFRMAVDYDNQKTQKMKEQADQSKLEKVRRERRALSTLNSGGTSPVRLL
jgi:hypothetical protein